VGCSWLNDEWWIDAYSVDGSDYLYFNVYEKVGDPIHNWDGDASPIEQRLRAAGLKSPSIK
jgi:hypothetical protein